MAWTMEQDGEHALAEAYCAVAVRYGEVNTLRGLGMIRAARGDLASARGLFWHAYNAGLKWVLPQIGELDERVGRMRRAERVCRRYLAEGGDVEAARGLMRVYEKSGRSQQAETLAQGAPDRLLWDLARTRADRGDPDGAVRLLESAVAAGDAGVLLQIARIHRNTGDLNAAESALMRARDAGLPRAQRELVELHRQSINSE
jgi:tetratricopeptide (TPR) repeat protein